MDSGNLSGILSGIVTVVFIIVFIGIVWWAYSKRTGPDLHRVGGKYSDEWHSVHLNNPRDLVPESNMPAYPWLLTAAVDAADMAPRMKALRVVGVPYSDAEIKQAAEDVKGRTEMEALIAYLQVLGTHAPKN